jgi:hypothetical protein
MAFGCGRVLGGKVYIYIYNKTDLFAIQIFSGSSMGYPKKVHGEYRSMNTAIISPSTNQSSTPSIPDATFPFKIPS